MCQIASTRRRDGCHDTVYAPEAQYFRRPSRHELSDGSGRVLDEKVETGEPWMSAADGNGLAIVADQVQELGGSERVLEAILGRYPAAALFAPEFSTTNRPDSHPLPWSRRVISLGRHNRRRHFLSPLYARRLAANPITGVTLILSLSHAGWAMAADIPPGARHISYNAGPPRWLYGHTSQYLSSYSRLVRPPLRAALPTLRAHHRHLMRRPDRLLTNSRWSAAEIGRLFGRSAEPIYPPVRTDFFTPAPRSRRHLLTVARLVPHKRIDVVVDAFRELDQELVVVGGGPCRDQLRERAPANVTFTGYVDDDRLRELYRSSIAFICPSIEEFGIAMVEAQATGTPVVAPRLGGALEIVWDRVSGVLLDRIDPRSIADAVRGVVDSHFDRSACRESAQRFRQRLFVSNLERVVSEEWAVADAAQVGLTRRRVTVPAAEAA
jgi:glycosyltransferase involved in cell wall biosynthesis